MKDTGKACADIIRYWTNPKSMEDWGGFDDKDLDILKGLRNDIVEAGKGDGVLPQTLENLIYDTDRHIHSYESAVLRKISLRNGIMALVDNWNEYNG